MAAPQSDPIPADMEARLEVERAERRRIAQLLHDTVSQSLTAAYLQATAIGQKLQRNGSDATDDVAGLAEMLHQIVVEMRAVTRQLSPEAAAPPEPPPKV